MNCLAVINIFDPDVQRCAEILSGFIRRTVPIESKITLLLCRRKEESGYSKKASDKEKAIASVIPSSRIISICADICFPQTAASFISEMNEAFDMILTPGNDFGNALVAHLGWKLSGTSVSCVTDAEISADDCVCSKRIYAGHVTGKYRLEEKPYILSVDQSLLPEPDDIEIQECVLVEYHNIEESIRAEDVEMTCPDAGSALEEAECIVICGMGLGNKANTDSMIALAKKVGMPVAGSRPCVMNAWMSMSRMVGVSGRILHPRIAILLGVSGAPAFYEGVKNSEFIIAINKDSDAPVKHKSDLFINGDCMDVFKRFVDLIAE